MSDISSNRFELAEGFFQDFEFVDWCILEASSGFEDGGDDHFVKAIFISNDENPDKPTAKGYFNVRFAPGSIVPEDVWATLDGHDLGKPSLADGINPSF